jgi:hypothetical protein
MDPHKNYRYAKHMAQRSCFPYIDGMNIHDYLNLPPETKGCSVDGCELTSLKKCKKNLCSWNFCADHYDHMHHGCGAVVNGQTCTDYGTYGISTRSDCAVCELHKNMYENNLYSNKKCKTCSKQQKNSGYCDTCFGIQYSLHKQGSASLFGPGR